MRSANQADLAAASHVIASAKSDALASGRELDVYTVGVAVCRPTRKEAEDLNHYITVEQADNDAIDNILAWRGVVPATPEDRDRLRLQQASGGGIPLIGTPDHVAETLAAVSRAGHDGIGLSFLNYADELPYFRDEVLPRLERLGLRTPQ